MREITRNGCPDSSCFFFFPVSVKIMIKIIIAVTGSILIHNKKKNVDKLRHLRKSINNNQLQQ